MTEPAMKVLSLWQPWASAIACGMKFIETRSWYTGYRGTLYIHATKGGLNAKGRARIEADERWRHVLRKCGVSAIEDLPRGVVVCRTNLNDVKPVEEVERTNEWESLLGDFSPGRYAWFLRGVTKLYPVEAKGAQGLWTPTKYEQHLILSAVRDAA